MDDPEASDLSIFRRILCGVDGTPASLIAVRHALRLQDEDGEVQLTAAAHVAKAAHAGTAAPHAAELLQAEAETALAEAIAFGVARSVAGRFRARLRAMASTKDQLDHGAAQEIALELEVLAAPLRLLDRARRL